MRRPTTSFQIYFHPTNMLFRSAPRVRALLQITLAVLLILRQTSLESTTLLEGRLGQWDWEGRGESGSFIKETEVDDDFDLEVADDLDDDEVNDDLGVDFIHRKFRWN